MKLITPESLAATARQRWEKQYEHGDYYFVASVRAKLLSLGDNPTPSQVNEAIGNNSWTRPPSCSECGVEAGTVMELGQEPDYESNTAWLCIGCVSKAFTVITGGKA